MNAEQNHLLNAFSGAPEIDLQTVTVIYENWSARMRAKALMNGVGAQAEIYEHFELKDWSFESLWEPQNLADAVATACDSLIVILSATHLGDLPRVVNQWLSGWWEAKNHLPAALVALEDEDKMNDSATAAALARLRNAARAHGIELFCKQQFAPDPQIVPQSRLRRVQFPSF